MSDDMFPRIIAYFVGGPADGQEQEVSSSVAELMIPAAVRDERPWSWFEDPARASFRTVAHSYKPCPETGEWLWQGVR